MKDELRRLLEYAALHATYEELDNIESQILALHQSELRKAEVAARVDEHRELRKRWDSIPLLSATRISVEQAERLAELEGDSR